MKTLSSLALQAVAAIATSSLLAQVPMDVPASVTVTVDAAKPVSTMNPRDLGGTNVALWNSARIFTNPEIRDWVADLHPTMIRIPGGSWTNCVYWNGNGVRDAQGKVDPNRMGPDGYPAVDYSGYAPSFNVDPKTLHPTSDNWHGNVDVKTLQEWIQSLPGVSAMPCLNAGTGRAVDAAEWVKWATKNGYRTKVWEVGNELGGGWEPGNFLPFDKGTLTAQMYTKRYSDIAGAMRAVDPNIIVGTCPFVEETLRDCGSNVDFVSIHAYPGSTTQTDEQGFAEVAKSISNDVSKVRGWIQKYQPNRADKIKVAYTEWNLAGGVSAAEMYSGLWASCWLAEMARNKVDMATQWDCFTHSFPQPSGHALIYEGKDTYTRKPQYYALWMWNNYNGSQVLPVDIAGDKTVACFSSRETDAVYITLVNMSRDRQSDVTINLTGFDPAATGETATLSSHEYLWNPVTNVPEWSTGTRIGKLPTAQSFKVSLAPFSLTAVRVPSSAKPELSPIATKALAAPALAQASKTQLNFVMPDEVYAGDRIEGLVLATDAAGKPSAAIASAQLSADGQATFDRPSVRLSESAGRFAVQPAAAGKLTLTAKAGDVVATKELTVKASVPRPVLFWDFANPPLSDAKTFESHFTLAEDLSMRANRAVARIDVQGIKPSDNQRTLLMVKEMPPENKLNRANIRGVFFDAMAKDIQCADPNAGVLVVMQSPANWWMPLGTIPLKDMKDWRRSELMVTAENQIKAMPSALNIWFILSANQPVTGTIYLDNIGFMVR